MRSWNHQWTQWCVWSSDWPSTRKSWCSPGRMKRPIPRIGSHLTFNRILYSLVWFPWFRQDKTPNRKYHVNLNSDLHYNYTSNELYPRNAIRKKKFLSGEFASRLKNFKIETRTRTLLRSPFEQREKMKSQMTLFFFPFNYGRKFTSDKKMPFAPENNVSMHWAFWATAEPGPGLSVDCSVVKMGE